MGGSVSWDHKRGLLLVLEGTNFYCRVSTKASNSRTFFSCTASFSGSESCTRRGEKELLIWAGLKAAATQPPWPEKGESTARAQLSSAGLGEQENSGQLSRQWREGFRVLWGLERGFHRASKWPPHLVRERKGPHQQ